MLKVRLQRVGRKNDPSFRVVVIDSREASQSGGFIEVVGNYNARHGKPTLNGERIKHWVSLGAQVSPTLHNLLIEEKILSGKKINVLPRKSAPKKKEEPIHKETVSAETPKETETPTKEEPQISEASVSEEVAPDPAA
ncbi:MAG: 30S ribosomal protein S16 [Minisyncoccota bacterium]